MRKTQESDLPMIAEWISRDSYHADVRPEFFVSDGLCLAFSDPGGIVCFVKLCVEGRDIRVHIQFNPGQTLRTAMMLKKGFLVVKDCAVKAKAERLVFDSMYDTLRKFCINRFGFTPIAGTDDLYLELEDVRLEQPTESNRSVAAAVL